jgi:hypothetical protein
LLAEDHERNAHRKAENDQRHTAFRRSGDGQDVVGGHGEIREHDVPDGLQQALGCGRGIGRRAGIHQHFHCYPDDEQAAGELHVRDAEQARREDGERNPQQHGAGRATRRPDAALAPGQGTHCHGDHQRVVAGQQQVDQDDREDTEQEVAYGHGRSGRPIHAWARRR